MSDDLFEDEPCEPAPSKDKRPKLVITEPGVYPTMDPDVYHADPCEVPAMSASLAAVLMDATPRHAFEASPRLNPDFERDEKDQFDLGTAAHEMLTGKGKETIVIDAKDWRTKAAKEAKEGAHAVGATPLLKFQFDRVERMIAALREELAAYNFRDVFPRKDCEIAMFWRSSYGVWCRSLSDWLDARNRVIWDYKTTGGYASPDVWGRAALRTNIELRAAHYLDGAAKIYGGSWTYRLVVQETAPPHLASVIELDASLIDIGQDKHRRAVALWGRCVQTKRWPAWPRSVIRLEAPPWHESQYIERRDRQHHTREALEMAHKLQAPR